MDDDPLFAFVQSFQDFLDLLFPLRLRGLQLVLTGSSYSPRTPIEIDVD